MIIQKAGVLKYLRYLGIFCAITMGFFSIVATSEDDAADVLGIDTDFSESAELELDEVTVAKSGDAQIAVDYKDCGQQTSIAQLVKDANISGLEDVDVTSVTFNSVQAKFREATWLPNTVATYQCRLEVTEVDPPEATVRDPYDAIFTGIAVDSASKDWVSISFDEDGTRAINGYLNDYLGDQLLVFEYCVGCDDNNEVDTFSAIHALRLNVTIKGDLF